MQLHKEQEDYSNKNKNKNKRRMFLSHQGYSNLYHYLFKN
jgi:hypothetical protein